MENRFYGIITICIVILLYYLSYRKFREDKVVISLILIIIAGFLLRFYTACDFYLHEWDERYHALVAKNLIDNPWIPMLYKNPILSYDYTEWWSNHIWVHKQPVPLYTMALSMWIFGKNVIALRLPSIFLSTISILFTFKIGKELFSKKEGLLAAFLFSIHGLIIEQTAGRVATDHIDVFFFSFISMAIYLFMRSTKKESLSSFIVASVLTALAILTKWLPGLIVLPIWMLYSYQRLSIKQMFTRMLLYNLIVVSMVVPWQWYILESFPVEAAWEYAYNRKHFTGGLGHDHPFYYHWDRMRIIFGELIYLPFLWLLFMSFNAIKSFRFYKPISDEHRNYLLISTWILIPYVFFSCVITKMQGYILFCAPAIFIATTLFFFKVYEGNIRLWKLKYLVLFLLIALPVRYSLERIDLFTNKDRSPEWVKEYIELGKEYKDQKVIVFQCDRPIEMMFYTGFTAYGSEPSSEVVDSLKSEGYVVLKHL